MLQGRLRMSCGCLGVAFLTFADRLLEMGYALLNMGVGLLLFGGLGMGQRGLGVGGEDIGMAHLAVLNGFFGMLDGLGDMILLRQRDLRRQE